MKYDPVKHVYTVETKPQVSKLKSPPTPPPLPPETVRADNPSPCFFEDGIRKIDFILVYKKTTLEDQDNGIKLRYFVFALEEFGLEMEGVDGHTNENLTFVKVHGREQLLMHYARMCNISMVMHSPFYFPEIPPPLNCMKNALNAPAPEYSSIYERAPETFAGVRPNKLNECERIMAVAQLLKLAPFGSQFKDRSLKKLLSEGVIHDAYPIHDGLPDWTEDGPLCDRQILRNYWSKMSQCLKSQPIHVIEKYFGPNVAFYYAWMEFFTIMLIPLAILGLISCICGLVGMKTKSDEVCVSPENDLDLCPPCDHHTKCRFRKLSEFCLKTKLSYILDNYFTILLAICTSIWATVFVICWKRKERKLGLAWDVDHMVISDVHRPEYIEKATVTKISSATGLPENYMNSREKYCRIALTYATCLLLMLIVVAAILSVGVLRLATLIYFNENRLNVDVHLLSAFIGAAASVTVIRSLNYINPKIVFKLTTMEIPRTQWEFDNSLVYKTFFLQFVNTFTPLFYLAFFKGTLFKHPGYVYTIGAIAKIQWDYCDVSGCSLELAIQLLLTMIVSNYKKKLRKWSKRVIIVFCKTYRHLTKDLKYLPRWEQDWFLHDIENDHIDQEFNESVIMYAIVTFFVAIFPLAPILALFNNILDIRLDAYKLTNELRRPVPKQVPGLGAWLDILKIITHLSMVTNAFIIAFTSQFIGRAIYYFQDDGSLNGYIHSTLSQFNTTDFPEAHSAARRTNITTCYYTGKRNPPNHPQKYQLTDSYWFEVSIKFFLAVVFEHVMILINHCLQLLIHKLPGKVRRRLKFERHQLRESRLTILNDAYKQRHGEIVTEMSKRMRLPQTTQTNVRSTY